MDLLTTWIDRGAQLRMAAVDATRAARSLCLLHELDGEAAQRFSQGIAGALLFASDLKQEQTLSMQADLGETSLHIDSTPGGLVRAMSTSRSHISTSARIQVRRLGQSGVQYHSVADCMGHEVEPALASFLQQSEQQVCHLELEVDLDAERLPSRVRGALLRGFPGTSEDLFDKFRQGWHARGPVWNAASPWAGLPLGPWDAVGSVEIQAFCPCDRERAFGALVALGPEAIADARTKGEEMEVICDFCRTRYAFSPEELNRA